MTCIFRLLVVASFRQNVIFEISKSSVGTNNFSCKCLYTKSYHSYGTKLAQKKSKKLPHLNSRELF